MGTITAATVFNYVLLPLGSVLLGAVLKHLYGQWSNQTPTTTPASTGHPVLDALEPALKQAGLALLKQYLDQQATPAVQTPVVPPSPAGIANHPLLNSIHNILTNPNVTSEVAGPVVQALASQLADVKLVTAGVVKP